MIKVREWIKEIAGHLSALHVGKVVNNTGFQDLTHTSLSLVRPKQRETEEYVINEKKYSEVRAKL